MKGEYYAARRWEGARADAEDLFRHLRGSLMTDERFRQRLMYRMMQITAIEQPCRLGEMMQAIFTHSPEFFDPDAPSNAGPHFVHPYTEFTEEMREELRMPDEDYEAISDDVRKTLHEHW